MRVLKYIAMFWTCVAVVAVAPAGAQQQPTDSQQGQQQGQQQEQPIPAIRSPLASAADNGAEDQTANPQQMQPDTRSLTGVEDLSIGTMALEDSYWQPRLAVSETVDSNPGLATAGNSWGTWTSLLGGVDIHRVPEYRNCL